MKPTKKEITMNENINLQTDTLIDLPIADEQADEATGGRVAGDYTTVSGKITAVLVDE